MEDNREQPPGKRKVWVRIPPSLYRPKFSWKVQERVGHWFVRLKGSKMQNSNLDVVFFVISLPPRHRGGRAWYEVADSSVKLPDGARIIGGSSTSYRSRAISLKKECVEGRFWRNRKRRTRDRHHEDRAHRNRMRRIRREKPQGQFDWNKYEAMYA